MKVYFISGLGADERAFGQLELPGVEPVYLNWIPPLQKESMESYAGRMAEKITEPDPIIIGLSFGGMIAIEIAKQIRVKKLILISSAKGEQELPLFFKMGRYIPLYKLIPIRVNFLTEPFILFFNGVKNKEQKKAIREIINNKTIADFNAWAVDRIVHWKNRTLPANLVHIHGDADKLLPYKYVKADYTIHGGGHFMIVNQAKELSALLQKLIAF